MASTSIATLTSSRAPPSSSPSSSKSPPVPSRSALRPKTSASTITRDTHRPSDIYTHSSSSNNQGPTMAAILAERPKSSPSPRQSYFDKYPRAQSGQEKVPAIPSRPNPPSRSITAPTDASSTARSKAARERLRTLKNNPPDSDSDDRAPQSMPKPAYAFPSVDDSDDNAASTSSSSPANFPRRPRQQSNASSTKARVRAPQHGHKRSPSTDVALRGGGVSGMSSRPPRDLPRSHGHSHLAALSKSTKVFAPSDLPFIRTSTSSSYTQTTLADQDHEFTPVSTPKSSLYRADGVLVAAPSSGIGVETMDALVHQMNGGTDTAEEADYMSSMFGRRTTKKEKRNAVASNGLLGGNFQLKHHPLYHPPLPSPPNGVALGSPNSKAGRRESETTEEERSSSNTASATHSAVSSSDREKENARRALKKVSSGALGSVAISKTTRSDRPDTGRSDVTVKAPARPTVGITDDAGTISRKSSSHSTNRDRERHRSRHKEKDRTRSRDRPSQTSQTTYTDISPSPPMVDLAEPTLSIDEIIRKNQTSAPSIVPSISDIIRTHAPAQSRPKRAPGPFPPSSYGGVASSTGHGSSVAGSVGSRHRVIEEEDEEVTARSSMDSIAAEVQDTLRKTSSRVVPPQRPGTAAGRYSSEEIEERVVTISSPVQKRPPRATPRSLHHAKSFGDRPRSSNAASEPPASRFSPYITSSLASKSSPRSESGGMSQGRAEGGGGWAPSVYSQTPSTPISVGTPVAGSGMSGPGVQPHDQTKLELAQFLRSPRLTRLLTLRRHPHAGLTVSMADVGNPNGHPVIVYLGLGCVRYLIALYDEMAEALNLRLVCVDRWGLGRTGEPKNPEGRGLLEWAAVIEEVADTLGIQTYSVVAHSAGAPYALAGVLKCGDRRVKGSVHLLAPWVSMSVDTGYKWLKYVPNSLIKTAQAAEWKVQGWKLGKPPTITYEAIGYNASAPVSSAAASTQEEATAVPSELRSSLSTSSYDDLADFDGQYDCVAPKAQTGGKTKKKPGKSILSIFNNQHGSAGPTPVSSARTSRASSINSGSAKTVSGKSPTLKGLKSLSSLRAESAYSDSYRRTSEPGTPTLAKLNDLPEMEQVGLGLGVDDEMMQWGARLRMLEEISPPTPPSNRHHGSTSTNAHSAKSRSSGDSRRKRSISLTSGRPTMDELPPVPPLPFAASAFGDPKSPITSVHSNATASTVPRKEGMSLTNALLRASHAESLKGGTADLLAILERDSKPWGFSYADVRQPIKVWYGDRDEKIAISSVRWMERVMKDCTLNIVKGGSHNLMTNAEVVVEVLESVARDWGEETSFSPVMVSSPTGSMPPSSPTASSSFYKRRATTRV